MWRALYLSFYSKDFYRDVGQNWRGLALSYLFLLVLLYCIPLTLTANQGFREFVDSDGQALIEKMPVMTFKSGKLSIPNPQPYSIFNGQTYEGTQTQKPLIIFDSTGAHKMDDLYKGQVLVTDRYVHLRENDGEIRSYAFDKFPDMVVDHGWLHEMANAAKHWFPAIFFVFILACLYLMRIIQVLIYGLFGMLFNKAMRAFLEYPQLVRLSVIALTPVLVIDTLLMVFAPGTSWSWLGFFLAMGYLVFGIRANRELIT